MTWRSRSVAVVGTRQASEAGLRRAHRLARFLVEHNFTVISGLAQGIDTAAHTAALETGGKTIAVIGTPLHTVYLRENLLLQREIAQHHLIISQVPFLPLLASGLPQKSLLLSRAQQNHVGT